MDVMCSPGARTDQGTILKSSLLCSPALVQGLGYVARGVALQALQGEKTKEWNMHAPGWKPAPSGLYCVLLIPLQLSFFLLAHFFVFFGNARGINAGDLVPPEVPRRK